MKQKATDSNLALIAITLGATAFMTVGLTSLPAIIIGTVALRKNAGDRVQAVLGIVFGVLAVLAWVVVVWLVGFHLFNAPIKQQASVPKTEYSQIKTTFKALHAFHQAHGRYPRCAEAETPQSCSDWQQFSSEHPNIIQQPVVFEDDATTVKTQPHGTFVYVRKAVCLLNTPTLPAYFRDRNDPLDGPSDDNVALVYFYDKGRACYATDSHLAD